MLDSFKVPLFVSQEKLQAPVPTRGERSITRTSATAIRRLALCLFVAAMMAGASARAASATPVVVFDHGRVTRENDRFLPPPEPPPGGMAASARRARPAAAGAARSVLGAMLGRGQIDRRQYDSRVKDYDDALFIRGQLSGTSRRELSAVVSSLDSFAARGQMTPSRLNVLWLELNRNVEWWIDSRPLAPRESVRFPGSRIIFRYFPGQGLRFHPLANWGRAEALISNGYVPNAKQMIAELLPLGADRGGALAWEYYFYFGGGGPPWTSGLSQGTALITLSAAVRRIGNPLYIDAIRQALRLYQIPSPTGVRAGTRRGAHYLEYSFAPRLRIINGFLQAVIGLDDAARVTGDRTARRLFAAGDREARYELPFYDTGRWSRYDNTGALSPLNYHVLLRDFLRNLCRRTQVGIYCSKARRFTADLRRGPPPGV